MAKKTLTFYRTYDIFVELATELDSEDALFVPSLSSRDGKEHICQLYTACTAEDTKYYTLRSFTSPTGAIRVVVATIVFGLGLDASDIRQHFIRVRLVISRHTYVPEIGRSGRDGLQSTAVLFLRASEQQPRDEVSKQPIQVYCTNSTIICRRQLLMSEFTAETIERPSLLHECCDVCLQECHCKECECTVSLALSLLPEDIKEMEKNTTTSTTEQVRLLDLEKCLQLRAKLRMYRKSLCKEATDSARQSIPLLFGVEIATGLTDHLIEIIVAERLSLHSVTTRFI